MALVDVLSFQITDYAGDVKTAPVYVPSGGTLADLQALADVLGPEIDAAIDGKLTGISVTVNLPVNGTIKGSPVTGNTVHEGALLSFSADTTDYRHSMFIPSWENAGFSGNAALNTGVYATLITDILTAADKYGNDLVAFLEGRRAFRK